MADRLPLFGCLLLVVQAATISGSCAATGVQIPLPSVFSSGYAVVPQSDMDSTFRQYLYNRSMGNLISYILSLKPYLIPILVLVGLQLVILIIVGVRKLVIRRNISRNPQKQPTSYHQVAVVFALLGVCLAAAGVIALAVLTIMTSNGASKVVDAAACQTNLSVNHFLNGQTDQWVGINKISAQIDQASLEFNNNVRQLSSGLVGLTVNSSKLGMPLNATFPTMELLVKGALIADYLARNTSANPFKYPICQAAPILLPNPDGTATQVRLSYQQTMCDGLTNETNMLALQAKSLDQMNAQLANLMAAVNRTNIINNLSALSSSYSSVANSSQLATFDLNPSSSLAQLLAYVMSGASIGLAVFAMIVMIVRNQRLTKAYPFMYVMSFLLTAFSAVVSVWYMTSSAALYSSCQLYSQAVANKSLYTEFTSTFNVSGSLDPIYFCAANPTATFLNSTQTTASLSSIANLTLLQSNFNNSIPADILTSKSIAYGNQISGYLADLSTLSINGSLTLASFLTDLDKVGDYTYPNSSQTPSCNASQDQFVFDPSKCTRFILDPNNATEVTTKLPRCIQLPINNRTSGSVNTSLNMVQHLFNLTAAPCNSMPNIFNNASNCFLRTRSNALFSAIPACASVATQYITKMKNLVAFSYLAGEYTDAFMQNLRNYLGIYLTLSSNMTAFYVGPNVTKAVGSIANNLTNISKLGNCSYPSQKLAQVQNAYCENVMPSMFQVFAVALGGLACMVLLTSMLFVAEAPLDFIITHSRISTVQHSKVRMDSSMNLDGEVNRGFDFNNITDNEPVQYQNVMLESSQHRNDQPEIIEHNKSRGQSNRSAQLVVIKSADQQRKQRSEKSDSGEGVRISDDRGDGSRYDSANQDRPERRMEKEPSSLKGSVKHARSEIVDKTPDIMFHFDQDPSNESKNHIRPQQSEEQGIEGINLEEKFEARPPTPEQVDVKTQEEYQSNYRTKPTEEADEPQIKKLVYARSAKNIILGSNAKTYLRKLHRQRERKGEEPQPMQVHDFGSAVSQREGSKDGDSDADPTTTKKLYRDNTKEDEDDDAQQPGSR